MASEAASMFSALRFVSGDCEHVCRLCLISTENDKVSLYDYVKADKPYADETLTFTDIFQELGVRLEPELPQVLCMDCANMVLNGYLFYKLCQFSYEKWNNVFHRLQESLIQSEKIDPNRKTAYIMFNDKDNIIITSRINIKSKANAVVKIKSILKSKTKYAEKKKAQTVDCDKILLSKAGLVKHVKKQNNSQNERIPCPQCAKYFSTRTQLKEHSERVHYPKTIQCAKCSKMFATERMLKRHEKIHHVAAICKECFVQFPSKNALRAHLDKHDVNKCIQCNKCFTNRQTYKLHLEICGRSDTRNPKFFCDLCDKGFARKNSLRTHLKTTHGYGHVLSCNWCKKKFDAISRLKNHIVKHTRERNFYCNECGGKFVTQAALVYHTRLHTGEKPFPCDMCEERFLSASRRMEHKRRKHLEPSKQCLYCKVKFVTKHELKKHVERHTNPGSKLYLPVESDNKGVISVNDPYILKYLD